MQNHHVKCKTHGENLPAIACRHLRDARASSDYVGWVQAQFDPAKREPGDLMAWCNECDKVYEINGDWDEASEHFADFRVVCEQCFHEICETQKQHRA